jgi:hypothetical protein
MAASRFVEVTGKEISEIKINSVPKTRKTGRGAGKSIISGGADIHIFVFADCKNYSFQRK